MSLKPLDRQVMVITGGSSDIGLATARMAVERGAKVVLSSRIEDALREASAYPARSDNLYEPKADAERGKPFKGWARQTSLYTEMKLNSWLSNAVMGAAVPGTSVALLALIPRRERRRVWNRTREAVAGRL